MIANSRNRISYAPPIRRRAAEQNPPPPPAAQSSDWRGWLLRNFPAYTAAPMPDGGRHARLWEWFAAIDDTRPRPTVHIWPRGGAKSTTVELGTAWVGQRLARRFGLYVSRTQTMADVHLQAIGTLLERIGIDRAVNKYNQSKGWTQQRLRASNGFNLVSFGMDAAMRGLKLDQYRPDLIIFDDIDDRHDSPAATEKKITTITESILPAGASNVAVVFIQNRIIDTGIAALLADGAADFLHDRELAVQEPAVIDLVYERRTRADGTAYYAITGGRPTWEGQSLAVCEQQINSWGRRAFEREAQHRTKGDEDGLWKRARDIEPYRVLRAPELIRVVVGVDPSATATGDEAGVVVAGLGRDGHGYVLNDLSLQGSPLQWARAAVTGYYQFKGDKIVAERNNGGEMVEVTIKTVDNAPPVKLLHASRGKQTRAEPVQKLAEEGRIHHVGTFDALEDELCGWKPGDPSPNRLDAYVWALTELMLGGKQPPKGIVPIGDTRAAPWSV